MVYLLPREGILTIQHHITEKKSFAVREANTALILDIMQNNLTMICVHSLLFLLATLPVVHGGENLLRVPPVIPAAQVELYNTTSRVFPAASMETYTTYTTGTRDVGVVIPSSLNVKIEGPDSIRKVLDPAVERFRKSLDQGVPDYSGDYKVNPDDGRLCVIHDIEIIVGSDNIDLYHGVAENYAVNVQTETEYPAFATVRALTVFGALRGLETLAQVIEFGWMDSQKEDEPVFVIHNIPLWIVDEPAYSYRGLLIDTARHYLPLNLILRNLDAMSMNKLNVLHWHLTDSQSWPYQTKSLPELATKGAFHPKRIYTTQDIQTVVQEAYLRGIRVIPEVDMPGHTRSIRDSFPDLMSHCPEPNEPLDPTNPDVFKFVETIYGDLKDLFPDSFVHLGGDEVDFGCWKNSKTIAEWMKAHNMSDTVDLYEYFETRLLRIVDKVEKTPIVWQEVFNLNLTISNNTIVDVWKGFDKETIEQATNQSYRVILSGCWYLDHLGDTWDKYYQCDPRDFNGTTELMIGGHASMWGEHVDSSNFMSRVWPRASAAAERLWTGNVSDGAEVNVKERIHKFRCRMVQQGFAAGPIGPGFCPHEVPYRDEVTVQEQCGSGTIEQSKIAPSEK